MNVFGCILVNLRVVRNINPLQFFINYKDNDFLNHTNPTPSGWGYAVFGHVIEGMEIIDAMTEIPTGNSGMHQDVPETDIVIESAQMID